MFQKVVPVNKERHASKKIKEVSGFAFASSFHIAYVTMQEFARAASIFPIVFLEDKDKDEFRPVVLLGLNAGENLFVGKDGKWQASYVPAIIRRYPFALTPAGNDGQYVVCIDEESPLVSDTEGAPLFDEKGEPTQVIDNVKRYLAELQQLTRVLTQSTGVVGVDPQVLAQNMIQPQYLSMRDLLSNMSYKERNGESPGSYAVAFWGRALYPLNVLVLVLCAMPFAFGTLRSGGLGKRMFVGMLLAIGWYFLQQALVNFGTVYGVPALPANLLPAMVLALAAWLYFRRHA